MNLKAPRMGGPLEVLRGLERAREGIAYLGGMFEVGVGRVQARQLEPAAQGRENSPVRVRLDRLGFGDYAR